MNKFLSTAKKCGVFSFQKTKKNRNFAPRKKSKIINLKSKIKLCLTIYQNGLNARLKF